jgi:hypothetical protein
MPRTEGMKFNAHEPGGKPACPLVEVAKHQPWAVQMGLQQYLAVHQLARLIAALHVICAEVHVEELNQPAHPLRTRRGDEGQDVLSQTELLQTYLILQAYRNPLNAPGGRWTDSSTLQRPFHPAQPTPAQTG